MQHIDVGPLLKSDKAEQVAQMLEHLATRVRERPMDEGTLDIDVHEGFMTKVNLVMEWRTNE